MLSAVLLADVEPVYNLTRIVGTNTFSLFS